MSRFLLGLGLLVPALAQTSSVSGIVRGDGSGLLSGAVVSLVHTETATPRKTLTTPSGRFVFPSLAPGSYTLEAKLPGFRVAKQDLHLQADAPLTVTVQLASAPAAETTRWVDPPLGPLAPADSAARPTPVRAVSSTIGKTAAGSHHP